MNIDACGPLPNRATTLLLTMAWPAAAAVSLAVAVGGPELNPFGLMLVACGTAAAYGLDRLIDRRDSDPRPLRRALQFCVLLAALGTGLLACTAWWRIKVCVVLAVVAGAYVPLKRHIPKNLMTIFAWTTAVFTLPFEGRPSLDTTSVAAILAVAFIMAANTLLSDLPDVAADRKAGVRGIVPRFGVHAGAFVAGAYGVLGVIAALYGDRRALAITAGVLALLAIFLASPPQQSRHRLLADLAVTFLPGPLALLLR